MNTILQYFLKNQKFILLDGAMATELERLGANLNHPLWSAKILLESPDLIRAVHWNYLEAGADIITTSSYQASFQGLEKNGVGEAQAIKLFQLSTQLATSARDEFWSKNKKRNRPLVAASVGPYGAHLADGSEYHGNYEMTLEALKQFHRKRLEVLANSGADLLLFETIPSYLEALALTQLLNEMQTMPALLSFSCKNTSEINDGTPFSQAVEIAEKCSKIIAVGINCTQPKLILPLLLSAKKVSHKPFICYPNSGDSWDSVNKKWNPGSADQQVFHALEEWVRAGAKLIGGCCRITPNDILHLAKSKMKN